VSLSVSINFNSLRIVNEELDHTIKQAATEFEAYLADSVERSYLDSCVENLGQIAGVFRLLQYPGAIALAEEMETLVKEIASDESLKENKVSALTHAFFVLHRYIEYIATRQYEMPILVVVYVNEMRVARGASLLLEQSMYPELAQAIRDKALPPGEGEPQLDELNSAIGRLRHMYQVGLLGVIKDQSSAMHFQLMSRAMSRATAMLGNHSNSGFWQLASAFLTCLAAGDFELTLHRKRYLAAIEKLMRDLVNKGVSSLEDAPNGDLQESLLFCLTLSGNETSTVATLLDALALPRDQGTDRLVAQQRELMHGPGIEAFDSVIKVVKEELATARDVLEISSQNNLINEEDLDVLKDVLSRIADTLVVLDLSGPQAMLREQLDKLANYNPDELFDFLAAADALLYVDSSLVSLKQQDLSSDALGQARELSRKEVIANSQLAEAERVVLEEAKSCISLAKRAITAYVDSNFEVAHIANVSTTLNTVRGGLYVLNFRRASAVVRSCCEFIDNHSTTLAGGGHRHQLLETLADALISIEYFLNEIDVNRAPDEIILEIAEESLEALGFAVEQV
jgi:hypothetical protein